MAKLPESNLRAPDEPALRTSAGLRDALFDEIDAFRTGKGDPQRAVAVSKLAAQILCAAKVEHEVARFRTSEGYAPAPLQLGAGTDE